MEKMKYILLFLCLIISDQADALRLKAYLPKTQAEEAIIVCPGGSYCWLDAKREGDDVAQWLAEHGVAAYVLRYSTAGWAAFAYHSRWFYRGTQYPDQLNEIRKALAEVRKKGYNHVGAMGFSAGGHLVLNAAEDLPESEKPDFIASIYPVVTMSQPWVHHRSRRGLLGEWRWRNKRMQDSLSMERHADRIHCSVFLINCQDDPVVDKHNAELMDSALTKLGKPHFFHQYRTGGHGFGADDKKAGVEAKQWKTEFIKWMNNLYNKIDHE